LVRLEVWWAFSANQTDKNWRFYQKHKKRLEGIINEMQFVLGQHEGDAI
jgi:hypothetical protein